MRRRIPSFGLHLDAVGELRTQALFQGSDYISAPASPSASNSTFKIGVPSS